MNRVIVLFMSCFLMPYFAFTQTPATDPHWKLDWQDNFHFFDDTKWEKKKHNTEGTIQPNLYVESCVWVANGNLVIEVNNNKVYNPTEKIWHDYSSGKVETRPDYNTKFGYIEARIKLPYRKGWGLFPAFWTFIAYHTPNPTNAAEIDIFEMFGGEYPDANMVNTCVHRCYKDEINNFPISYPTCDNGAMGVKHIFPNFSYADWHTYAIEWNANRIIWYIDGKAIRTLNNHNIVDPVMIKINMAILGADKQKKYLPPTTGSWSEYMYVDYVRVYSLKCDKNTVVTDAVNGINFNTYNYAVKKSITMSNKTTIPAGSNIYLRATDFIELKPGFEVQTGRELYLDITPCEDGLAISKPKMERND